MTLRVGGDEPDVYADPATERLRTPATLITLVRTVAALGLAGVAARQESIGLLVVSLVVYLLGDSLDGLVARVGRCETRTGAVLDLLCDRVCAAAVYVGLVWLEPGFALPVLVYLASFVVVDGFLSLAFLAWPLRSINYFYVVDRTIWVWNWSLPAKAANSGLFAVALLATGQAAVGAAVALGLLAVKSASLARLVHLGIPIPTR